MQKKSISSVNITEKDALSKAAALCSRRECCVSEIRQKLEQWGAPAESRERIVDRLIDEKYIDESRFARAFALDKLRYNHWGRIKIDQSMRLLGISPDDRRTALDELPADEYRDILQHLVRTKLPTIKASSDYERQGKLMRFLASRGFEPNLVTLGSFDAHGMIEPCAWND